MAIVNVGADGKVSVYNNSGLIDVVADVVGWIGPLRINGSVADPGGLQPVEPVNVIAVGPTTATHLTVWPSGEAMPIASSLNVTSGETRANLVMATVGTDGKVELFNNAGTTDIVADMVAWIG